MKYTGWSRLSREFLTQVACTDKNTGEVTNIISALWDTNLNLMQLLYSEDYVPTFGEQVAACNQFDKDVSLRQMVEDLYVSPKVKRPIYQSLLIAREIEKIQKCPPKKIFIEVARGEEKKERKKSRKAQLLELYQSCKRNMQTYMRSWRGPRRTDCAAISFTYIIPKWAGACTPASILT